MAPTKTKEAVIENTHVVDVPLQVTTNHSSLAGRIQIVEATGVSLDYPTGADGVTNPLTNDHLPSAGPLVGGHLSSFRREWREENCSNKIFNIITNGYILQFINNLILATQPLILSIYKDRQKDLVTNIS